MFRVGGEARGGRRRYVAGVVDWRVIHVGFTHRSAVWFYDRISVSSGQNEESSWISLKKLSTENVWGGAWAIIL